MYFVVSIHEVAVHAPKYVPSSASKDASSRLLLFRLAQQAFRHGQVEDGQRV